MLEKMSLRQQKIIQTDDIKHFDNSADYEKAHEKLPEAESMIFSVNAACGK